MRTAVSGLMLVILATFFWPATALAEGTLPLHWPAGTPAKSLSTMTVKSFPIKLGQP
jgi:hypothetical protein